MKTKCSKQTIRRFIKFFLAIDPTPYWFHQTLTFKGHMNDQGVAKERLKKLLDSLGKVHRNMAAFFVQESKEGLDIHFHLIFLFFGPQTRSPKAVRQWLVY